MSFLLSKQNAKVVDIKSLTPKLKQIVIESETDITFTPGQYITLFIGGVIPRNYSIANDDLKVPTRKISLLINVSTGGVGARTTNNLLLSDNLNYIGPFGEFRVIEDKKDIWFICVGSGISPLIPMILQKKKIGGNIKLFFGSRNKANILDLSFLSVEVNYSITSVDKDWDGYIGRTYDHVLDHMKKSEKDINSRYYYICGMPQMVQDTKNKLIKHGVLKSNIIYEKY